MIFCQLINNSMSRGLYLKEEVQMKYVKFWLSAVVMAVSISLGSHHAMAGPIVGSEALSAGVSGTTDLNTDTGKTLTSFQDTGNTGDFSAVSGISFSGSVAVDFTLGSSLTISDSAWGTFAGTLMIDDNSQSQARTDTFVGTFTPGTDFPGSVTSNTASLVMSFTQSGGAGNSISDSLSLHAPTIVTVPEPTGLAIFGAAAGLVGLMVIRRRARRSIAAA
jgi:hypothetical protein